MWAACCVCFLGFLRLGKITVLNRLDYDPTSHLSFCDLAVDDREHPTMLQLNLKSSKTDSFRKGVQIVIERTGDDLCPVVATLAYLVVHGGNQGPFKDGSLLTRSAFVRTVKEALQSLGYPPKRYSGHSFRAGVASTAVAAWLADLIIKTMGRWESSAYLLYTRIPRDQLRGVSSVLSKE